MSSDTGKKTFNTLNGLRGIAAIAVVNAHLQFYFCDYYLPNVALAVDFFFLLSGFVIAHAYELRLQTGMSTFSFMRERMLRLYPLYFLGLVIGGIVAWFSWTSVSKVDVAASLATGLLFLPTPEAFSANRWRLFPFDLAAWSLLFELVANAAYGVLNRRLNNVVLCIVIVVSFAGLLFVGFTKGTLDLGVTPDGFFGGMARGMFSFFAGVALHRLWQARSIKTNIHPAAIFVLLIAPLLVPSYGPHSWVYSLVVIAVYFPFLLLFGAQSSRGRSWTRISATLGLISYPLYVLHVPIWEAIKAHYDEFLISVAPTSGILFLLVLVLIALAVEKFVDAPLRQLLKSKVTFIASPSSRCEVTPSGHHLQAVSEQG